MADNFDQRPTVTDSPRLLSVAETPRQRSFRGVLRDDYEEEGDNLVDALLEDLDSTGFSDEQLQARTGVDKAQLARIRAHKAHAPGKLISWAIENTRHAPPRYVAALCAAAEGEFKPKPPPSDAEWHQAERAVLHEMGIADVVHAKAAAILGRSKP